MTGLEINVVGEKLDCEPNKRVNLNFYGNTEKFVGKNMFFYGHFFPRFLANFWRENFFEYGVWGLGPKMGIGETSTLGATKTPNPLIFFCYA